MYGLMALLVLELTLDSFLEVWIRYHIVRTLIIERGRDGCSEVTVIRLRVNGHGCLSFF